MYLQYAILTRLLRLRLRNTLRVAEYNPPRLRDAGIPVLGTILYTVTQARPI